MFDVTLVGRPWALHRLDLWTISEIIPSTYLRKITAMSVCLTSTVDSPPPPPTPTPCFCFFFFFTLTSPPVIKVGKLDTPNVLCFHLVVTVTWKHRAAVNEIPACHQSPADKDGIVVVFEGMCRLRLNPGASCGRAGPWAEAWMFTPLPSHCSRPRFGRFSAQKWEEGSKDANEKLACSNMVPRVQSYERRCPTLSPWTRLPWVSHSLYLFSLDLVFLLS